MFSVIFVCQVEDFPFILNIQFLPLYFVHTTNFFICILFRRSFLNQHICLIFGKVVTFTFLYSKIYFLPILSTFHYSSLKWYNLYYIPWSFLGLNNFCQFFFFFCSLFLYQFTGIDLPLMSYLIAQSVKNLPATRETPVQFLGREDLLEKGQVIHSSILGLPLWLS